MKTQVLITGKTSKMITELIYKALSYQQRQESFLSELISEEVSQSDFIVIDYQFLLQNRNKLDNFLPNIVFLDNFDESFFINTDKIKFFSDLIEEISLGGIIIYNEEVDFLTELVENSQKQVRKIPISTSEIIKNEENISILTSEGELFLQIKPEDSISVVASQWICQNMGIDADDFFQSLI